MASTAQYCSGKHASSITPDTGLARSSVMSPALSRPEYGVVVPVKPTAVAKSRLAHLGDAVRRELVAAFAADTVSAALESPLVKVVLVVTDDHLLARDLAGLGAQAMPDGRSGDLNGSLVQAAAELARRWPDLRIAALCADLPTLRPDELSTALGAACDERQSFVADEQRTGTTLLAAPDAARFEPCFGPGSRQAHLAVGAMELDLADVPSLRRDVDTSEDLADALRIGVGARTSSVAGGLRL
jgi:2-phospho-L-lactate guanylyltransferase